VSVVSLMDQEEMYREWMDVCLFVVLVAVGAVQVQGLMVMVRFLVRYS
jgi:hypothetical protein